MRIRWNTGDKRLVTRRSQQGILRRKATTRKSTCSRLLPGPSAHPATKPLLSGEPQRGKAGSKQPLAGVANERPCELQTPPAGWGMLFLSSLLCPPVDGLPSMLLKRLRWSLGFSLCSSSWAILPLFLSFHPQHLQARTHVGTSCSSPSKCFHLGSISSEAARWLAS